MTANAQPYPSQRRMPPSTLPAREQAASERAEQVDTQPIMMLVHELRSPAAASKSMVATLRYLNPQDAQLGRILVRIEKRMDQLLELMDEFLGLSQAQAGCSLDQADPLDLIAETRAACGPYEEDAAAKGLAMSVHVPNSSLTGLGLAAVKALVESCNGELEVESHEGKGSRFSVRLPLCRAEASQQAGSHLPAERKVP